MADQHTVALAQVGAGQDLPDHEWGRLPGGRDNRGPDAEAWDAERPRRARPRARPQGVRPSSADQLPGCQADLEVRGVDLVAERGNVQLKSGDPARRRAAKFEMPLVVLVDPVGDDRRDGPDHLEVLEPGPPDHQLNRCTWSIGMVGQRHRQPSMGALLRGVEELELDILELEIADGRPGRSWLAVRRYYDVCERGLAARQTRAGFPGHGRLDSGLLRSRLHPARRLHL